MEMREWLDNAGNRCACRAAAGRPGMWMVAVWLAWMLEPSGRRTLMPCATGVTLLQGLLSRRKWPVHPVSAIAWCCDALLGGCDAGFVCGVRRFSLIVLLISVTSLIAAAAVGAVGSLLVGSKVVAPVS